MDYWRGVFDMVDISEKGGKNRFVAFEYESIDICSIVGLVVEVFGGIGEIIGT
jgi:hypothetical protein